MKKKLLFLLIVIIILPLLTSCIAIYKYWSNTDKLTEFSKAGNRFYNDEYQIDFTNHIDSYGLGTITIDGDTKEILVNWRVHYFQFYIYDISEAEYNLDTHDECHKATQEMYKSNLLCYFEMDVSGKKIVLKSYGGCFEENKKIILYKGN